MTTHEDKLLEYAWGLLRESAFKHFLIAKYKYEDIPETNKTEFRLTMSNIVTSACTVPDES